MVKDKICLIFAAALLLNFSSINTSFSEENTGLNNRFPDYAYEFVGQDKYEKFNRKMFNFNLKLNKYVVKPINIAWSSIMPQYGMDRIHDFYTNMSYPVRLAGCLVQKDYKSSKSETVRFLTNTTIGLAGLYDPAQSVFKIEPRKEDMEQALAYRNVKQGPFLVLPFGVQGNLRDIGGSILDLPLNPTSFIIGPAAAISTGISLVNDTTYLQPIFKMADSYADPYDAAKQLYGVDKYIKNTNLDRAEVFKEKTTSQQLVNATSTVTNAPTPVNNAKTANVDLKADIKLDNYNPQSSSIDALRTILFDNRPIGHSMWSELSVWNKTFCKKLKMASVNINYGRPKYKYKYVMQKNKKAPIAIIYPSIGADIRSDESVGQAKILYDEGYSVIIMGSAFEWEFVKSMPADYSPGLPAQDAYYLRKLTAKILEDVEIKTNSTPSKKLIVGTSFGALTSLFVASQEEKVNTLGISNYIAICPPIQIFYALKQIDKYSQGWQNLSSDNIKLKAAITAEKITQVAQSVSDPKIKNPPEALPFTEDEARLAISYTMKQILSDVVFAIENDKSAEKSALYKKIDNMSFDDYVDHYIIAKQSKPLQQLAYDSSLYSIESFLKENKNYKIYHSLDDCFVNPQQLSWLKQQTGDKSVFFSNGSHLGFLYRKEFVDEFQKDTKLK